MVYELANKACHIYDVNSKDKDTNETEVKGYDLYEREYGVNLTYLSLVQLSYA